MLSCDLADPGARLPGFRSQLLHYLCGLWHNLSLLLYKWRLLHIKLVTVCIVAGTWLITPTTGLLKNGQILLRHFYQRASNFSFLRAGLHLTLQSVIPNTVTSTHQSYELTLYFQLRKLCYHLLVKKKQGKTLTSNFCLDNIC